MSYENRYRGGYSRELSPEQKARQTLLVEALKEQAAYERSLRRKTVKAVKDISRGAISILVLVMVAYMLFSCEKEETPRCVTVDLGQSGQAYEPVYFDEVDATMGNIYVDGDRIKQQVCYNLQ